MQPFPDDLAAILEADERELRLVQSVIAAKVVGYFTGKGLTNLRIDIPAKTYEQVEPDADQQ